MVFKNVPSLIIVIEGNKSASSYIHTPIHLFIDSNNFFNFQINEIALFDIRA